MTPITIVILGIIFALLLWLYLWARRFFASYDAFPQLMVNGRTLFDYFAGDGLLIVRHWFAWRSDHRSASYVKFNDCFDKYAGDKGMLLIWMGPMPWLLLYSPEALEPVFSSPNAVDKSFNYWLLNNWLGQGLLTSRKQKWLHHRKLLTTSFHYQILRDRASTMRKNAKLLCQHIVKLRNKGDNVINNIKQVIQLCALDIICESVMGISVNAQLGHNTKYVEAVDRSGHEFSKRLFYPPLYVDFLYALLPSGRRYNNYLKTMRNFTVKAIQERMQYHQNLKEEQEMAYDDSERETTEQDDATNTKKKLSFLDKLISEYQKDPQNFTMQDMIDEVQTFMFAGHESTTWAMTWTCYLLGLHPEIQERLYQEICSFPDFEKLDLEGINSLRLLDAVFKESLRLYPIVPMIGRFLWQDLEINSPYYPCQTIPKYTTIFVCPRNTHLRQDHWPYPERFMPERFLDQTATSGQDKESASSQSNGCQQIDHKQENENKSPELRSRHPYAYIPFSGGPRNCIGQRFAMMEGKMIIAHIVKSFQLTSLDQPDKIILCMEMTLRSLEPIRIAFKSRQEFE